MDREFLTVDKELKSLPEDVGSPKRERGYGHRCASAWSWEQICWMNDGKAEAVGPDSETGKQDGLPTELWQRSREKGF